MTSERLSQAIQLIKSGNKAAALPILREIVQIEPNNENAWLWLYSCVENIEQKKYCLSQALRINPTNQDARNALLKLESQTLAKMQPTNRETESALPPVLDNRNHPAQKSKISVQTVLIGVLSISILCLAGTMIFLFTNKNTNIFENLPSLASAKFEVATGNPSFIIRNLNGPFLEIKNTIQLTINYPTEITQGGTVKLKVTCANNSEKPIENFTIDFAGKPEMLHLNINYFDGISVISTDPQIVKTARASSGDLFFEFGTVSPNEKKDVFLDLTANQTGVYVGFVHLMVDQGELIGFYDLDFTTTVK